MLGVHGLQAGYGRVSVLRGVSLDVSRGELVAIVGPNGSGKTTLLRAVTGLLRPRGGRVTLDGEDVTAATPEALVRRGLVMVPEGRELFGGLSVRDNLRLGGHGVRDRRRCFPADLERVLALFPALAPRLAQPAGTLSGGEQQMVAIGRALVARPRLLVLDEPSVGLAPLIVRDVFDVLARLRAEGLTMLVVEQNARAALRVADRAYTLRPGGAIVDAGRGADEAARAAYGLRTQEATP